jgi:hypothetical protein
MNSYQYVLGAKTILEQLFPNPADAEPGLNFKDYADVIRHYTRNSLAADGIPPVNVGVRLVGEQYQVSIEGNAPQASYQEFAGRHIQIFSSGYAAKAIAGVNLLKELNVWNPMEGYHVNSSLTDGTSKWALFPPLGLNVIGQRGMTLMHYPPWAVLQAGTFDNAMTMQRWSRLLGQVGIPEEDIPRYKTFIDINPIAAPGEGESEYPNDYFPIMMASGFFDGPPTRDYIRSMLELYLNPPGTGDNLYTLPLLICGSPLYDPQAPGWFRTAYTDILPQDENGIPQVNVMQVGKFRVYPNSPRETPYMICNHMIAAGVTGRCTDNPCKIPDIRQYEAQDLVAASFLKLYSDNPNQEPEEVKRQACYRWYGNFAGTGVPNPPVVEDQTVICALAQMDLFYEPFPNPHPKFTWEQAKSRCQNMADPLNDPCANSIGPPGGKSE